MWQGMKTITGFRQLMDGPAEGSLNGANEPNSFFNRFDNSPSCSPPTFCLLSLQIGPHHPPITSLHNHNPSSSPTTTAPLLFTTAQVRRVLGKLHRSKASSHDGISPCWPRVLRSCAGQLCRVLQHLFNLSLSIEWVPVLWKTSYLVMVPKKGHPNVLNDYSTVALPSHVIKRVKGLVLSGAWSVPSWNPCSSPTSILSEWTTLSSPEGLPPPQWIWVYGENHSF